MWKGKSTFMAPHVPITRGWVAETITGVPFGAHTAWLVCTSTGTPMTRTRTAPATQVAVTHGLGAPEMLNGQPATACGAARVTTGWPVSKTRGWGAVAWAMPPCAQVITEPTVSKGPGMPPQITVSAPALISTAGPIMVMMAPLPLLMVMPISLIISIAPVVVLSKKPPVGPGRSLIESVFCKVVCSTMLGLAGLPASASTGTSAGLPQKQPVQIG